MSNYIHFSPEQKDKAYHMDIAELLRKQGEKLNRCGNEYIWESPTGKVSIRNNVWYHHYEMVLLYHTPPLLKNIQKN